MSAVLMLACLLPPSSGHSGEVCWRYLNVKGVLGPRELSATRPCPGGISSAVHTWGHKSTRPPSPS